MIRVPGYILTKKLGVGGMATVYLALQTSLQRQVALKVMAPAFASDRSFAHRFVAEARTIAELNHPNIVAVHDVGVTEEGLHYFAMQHLPNGDLEAKIRAGLRERELIRILLGICGALEHAHARGFVHRDVTPGNVLFDTSDLPVLTDFGIARVVTEATRMTATGLSLGTSHYMSPEQARGRRVDFRSDLYSLGAVTYEALVGRPPYEGDDSFSVAYAHVYDPVPKVPDRLRGWQSFVDQAMAKDPAKRFQSAEEVRYALEALYRESSQAGRRTPDIPEKSEREPESVALKAPRTLGEGRFRWLKLAMGRGPKDWLRGLLPTVKWTTAWLSEVVSQSHLRRWGLGALALLVAVAGLWWLLSLFPDGPRDLAEPQAVTAVSPVVEDPAPAQEESAGLSEPEAGDAEELPESDGLDLVASYEPDDPALVDLENGEIRGGPDQQEHVMPREFRERILELLAQANLDMTENRLTTPEDNCALEKFEQILSFDEDNIQALDGIDRIILTYVAWARTAMRRRNFDEALSYQSRGTDVATRRGLLARRQKDLSSITDLGYEVAFENGREAADRGQLETAAQYYREALRFRPGDPQATGLLDLALNPPPAGPQILVDALADGTRGPQMVELEGGRLAAGTTEITVDLYRRFIDASGDRDTPACRHLESRWRSSRRRTWDRPGFDQTGRHPVVCVSWIDARDFAAWLSAETGQQYRLPTESEWLLLAAGSNPEGDCSANLADASLGRVDSGRKVLSCDDGWSYAAPVKTYPGSAAGVFDAVGNVREWVSDCTEEGRGGACRERRAMGSSWLDADPAGAALTRESFDEDRAYNTVGFRLVRDM